LESSFIRRRPAAYSAIQALRAAGVPNEATIFGLVANITKDSSEDMVLAYLVDLDGQEDRP
jgi:hypothetical protein